MTKILVVDDYPQNINLLQDFLQAFNYQVISAMNGAEALEKARKEPPDLIISDILMPVMDGFTLCYEWKRDSLLKNIPFVFYTSTYIDIKDKELALKVGADKFIQKPMDLKKLLNILNELITNIKKEKNKSEQLLMNPKKNILKLYNERLVRKLEKKMNELEREVDERKKAEEAIAERLRFESLISGISSKFINIPVSDFDKAIRDDLNLIGEFFTIDRVSITQCLPATEGFSVIHSWVSEEFKGSLEDSEGRKITELEGNEFILKSLSVLLIKEGIFVVNKYNEIPSEWNDFKEFAAASGIKACVIIALKSGGRLIGSLNIDSLSRERIWPVELLKRFSFIGELFSNALSRKQAEMDLKNAFSEIKQLKEQLEEENIYLLKELKKVHHHSEIIGVSNAIKNVLIQAEQVAPTDSTVLILGETGTGKELLAREIHRLSSRNEKPLITVNCAAIPSTLIESELFGHEKGAFTGALSRQIGRFEIASGGTIFLDEIGELPQGLQAKLLRVLQEGKIERLGKPDMISVNVRVIAATNRNLDEAVRDGTFREDLYYRLNVFPIIIPPLRQRMDDIPHLIWFFVKEFGERMGKKIEKIPRKNMDALKSYPWPGNVRELRNVIERAMIQANGSILFIEVPQRIVSRTFKGMTLEEIESKHIIEILNMTDWRIRGENGAANILGLKPTTLESRMQRLGIKKKGIQP